MNLQAEFEKWLLTEHHPEADVTQRNGHYVNSTTRLIWVGWQGCYRYFKEQKRRESEGKEYA